MIEVRYRDRLGNNLFQYCLGRILAEDFGYALRAEPIPGFPNTHEKVEGIRFDSPEQTLTGQRIDFEGILTNRPPRRIVLDGWFQRYEYYLPHRAKIREWLAFDPAVRLMEPSPDIVIHVRRTDYVPRGWALPFSFYRNALEELRERGGEVWIVTDDERDPFFQNFAPWRPKYRSGTPLEQMAFMSSARNLVLSQSTFSWWPAFLGNAEVVVCPIPSVGCWSERADRYARGIDLIMRDQFTCIECREPYRLTISERSAKVRRSILGHGLRSRLLLARNRLQLRLPERER